MLGARTANCPNCGGPIEFGLGSSSALVCPHCRYSVVRTDKDLQAIGRVADLVPTAPPIEVGDSGTIAGKGFRVAGRLQLDHGRGPWDEWYVGFDEGGWGWLARAQGRWYMTRPADASGVPAYQSLQPGQQGSFSGTGETVWTVQEQGQSTLLSGEGELPFPVVPGQRGWYIDLAGAGGGFATIDYGDGTGAPMLFAGRELGPDELQVAKTAWGERTEEKVQIGKVSCPTCGAPVEISSESTERAACAFCYSLLDVQGQNLQLLRKLEQPRIEPYIPLGTDGELKGEKVKVIGFMERYTVVHGVTYSWREYLLYTEQGYRWLMEDSGHWMLLKPISVADVQIVGSTAKYGKHTFKRFGTNSATVRFVIGEFYWKVEVGEQTTTSDYIKPPQIISEERSESEIVWSAGEYVDGKEVWKAFGLQGSPPSKSGVGTAQPNPHALWPTLGSFAVLLLLFLGIALGADLGGKRRTLVAGPITLPPTQSNAAPVGTTPQQDTASYTPPFTITDGPAVLEVELQTSADNDYVGVACALIDEESGNVREFFVSTEYYHGVTGGESWTDGSRNATIYVDQVPEGRYVLRMDPQWNHWTPGLFNVGTSARPPTASIEVVQGSRSPWCCLLTFLLLLVPVPISIFRRAAFEKKRWENSNLW